MDIRTIDPKQLSQLAQLKTDELAGKCFVSADEIGKDVKIAGRSVRLAAKTEVDSRADLTMRNRILESLKSDYDIKGFEDEVRGLLEIPKQDGKGDPESGEKLVDAARVRDVVRYVQAKTADVDGLLGKVLLKTEFYAGVKEALRRTLVNEASNDIVSEIINAEKPTLDDLTRLCRLAAQTHPQETFADRLAVAYLKGFSATVEGDVPTVGNLAARTEQLKASEEKGAADHQQEVIAQTEKGPLSGNEGELREKPYELKTMMELRRSLRKKLGDGEASGILEMIDGHVAKLDPSVKESFKDAVASLMLDRMSGKGDYNRILNLLFKILKDFENGIKKSTPAEAKFYLLCVKFNLKLKNEIVGKLKSDVERAIADDFMLKMQGFVDGTDTSLYRESVHNEQIDDNALESRWEEAIKASHLKDAKLNRRELKGFFAKESKFDPAKDDLPVEKAGKTVIKQLKGSNMCYIKSPINGLLAAGQLEKVEFALTPDADGSYSFNLGEEFVKKNQDKTETVYKEIKVTKEEIADIRNAGGEEFSDVELALYLAHNKTTDDPVELKMFGEADRVINCFGYQRSSDLRKESKISINREPLINAGRSEKKAKYLQDGLGDALAKVYDAGQWLDHHKDGVMLLNINESHFVAVTGVYYENDRDFGFVVRDSLGGDAHTVNVRENGDMFMADAYVPSKASEYKPLT